MPFIPRHGKLEEGPSFLKRIGNADFKGGWNLSISLRGGCLVYQAFRDGAYVTLLYNNGTERKLTFNKGGKVFITFGGKVSYTKPVKKEDL